MSDILRQTNLELKDQWAIIVKRRWVIISIFSIITVTTLLASMSMDNVYKATAQILIESDNPNVMKVDDVTNQDAKGLDYYQTQYKILQSRTLARDVIRRLALETQEEFNQSGWIANSLKWIKGLFASAGEADDPSDPLNPYILQYLDKLTITPVPRSRLVDINFEGNNRILIAKIANEHAASYNNLSLSFRLTGSKDAANWLLGQTESLKATLRKSEDRLQDFIKKNDMLALESMVSTAQALDKFGTPSGETRGSSEANFISQKVSELNSQQTAVRTEKIAAETLARQIKSLSITPEMIESIPEISSNLLIQKLKGDYVGLARQLSDMREKFGDKHPKMIAIKEEMNSLNSKIKIEVAKIAKGVELQYEVAVAKEKNLEKSLEELKTNAAALNEKAVKYLELKSDVDLNRDLYNRVMKRAKETTLSSGLEATNVVVVDPAEVPIKPVRPRLFLNLVVSAFLGILIGLSTAYFTEYIDGSIDTPDQIEHQTGIPCLGLLEKVATGIKGGSGNMLDVLDNIESHFPEAVRSVAANLIFSIQNSNEPPDKNVLIITSAVPEEGKTSVAASLAVMLTQMNRRVLLIDCDLRKPKIFSMFGLKKEPGLVDMAIGNSKFDDCIRKTKYANLDVMPPGVEQRNPMPLISYKGFEKQIRENSLQKYDIVIIDTPPIMAVTDAQILAGMFDWTLVIVKAASTHSRLIKKVLKELATAKANVVGTVLNQVDVLRDKTYYKYYGKYYNYYEKVK